MDDFSVFGSSFDHFLNNLDKMIQRCKDAHLVLNWEKCHFMVKEGIVLGHKVSEAGLEVEKAKIEVISKLPPLLISKLVEKDTLLEFNEECHNAFKLLKEKLTCTPVIVSPNWNLPFELMCDASDFVVGAILGQKDSKKIKSYLKLDWAKNQKTKSSLNKIVAFADEGNSNSDTNKIIAQMDAMIVKMDAQYKELQSRAKQLTPDLDDDDMPMSREEEAKFMKTFHKTRFYNDYRDRDSNRDNWRSSGHNDYNQDNYRSNTDDEPYDLQKTIQRFHEISTINQLLCQRHIH
ncbi:reverse transcriptase domain-containing protein [Tanacetum coccineum]